MSSNHIPDGNGVCCGSRSFVAISSAHAHTCTRCLRSLDKRLREMRRALEMAREVLRPQTCADGPAFRVFERIEKILGSDAETEAALEPEPTPAPSYDWDPVVATKP